MSPEAVLEFSKSESASQHLVRVRQPLHTLDSWCEAWLVAPFGWPHNVANTRLEYQKRATDDRPSQVEQSIER